VALQIVHAELDTLALDILRLMKDVVGGSFDTKDLADALVDHYDDEYGSLKAKLQQVFDRLNEQGLVESVSDSAFPNIIQVTRKGDSIKQITEEDDVIVRERHFHQLLDSLRRELSILTLSTPISILTWTEDAERVICDHAGSEVARPLTAFLLTAINGWACDVDSKRTLSQCLDTIQREYSQPAPLTFNPQPNWEELVQRVRRLAHRWSGFAYRGRTIGASTILRWLEQFDCEERPFMLRLLEQFDPISDQRARDQMVILYREIGRLLNKTQPKLLVSASNRPGKSGSRYARMFQQERRRKVRDIPIDDIQRDLPHLASDSDALVFIDDLVGSGSTAIELINQLNEYAALQTSNRPVFVCCLYITDLGLKELQDAAVEAPYDCRVVSVNLLRKCFSDDGGIHIFGSLANRDRALQIAEDYGHKLRPMDPLGFDDGQLLIAFPDNCPDNCLPIIFAVPTADSENKRWIPLFPRSEG